MIEKKTFVVLAAMACSLPQFAEAEPLDKGACDALAAEIHALTVLNVDKMMNKGPQWAVANLSTDDLNHIRRYIELDEQIKFRCMPATALVTLGKVEGDEDEAPPLPAPGDKSGDQADDNGTDADKDKDADKTEGAAAKKPDAKAAAKKTPAKPVQPKAQVKPKDAAKKPVQATAQPAKSAATSTQTGQ